MNEPDTPEEPDAKELSDELWAELPQDPAPPPERDAREIIAEKKNAPAEPMDLKTKVGCWATVIAVFALIVGCTAMMSSSGSSGGGGTVSDRDWEARKICHEFVKDRLKAPAGASFEPDSQANVTGSQPYTSVGYVDAPNSFGAPIRNHYTCKVTLSGDKWKLVSLTGLGS